MLAFNYLGDELRDWFDPVSDDRKLAHKLGE
jgi:ABC-type dipeptide/oligopeptide/nickel transport system permease subunit